MKATYKIGKTLLIIVLAMFLLLVIANFCAGTIAKNYINNHSKELCGRIVKIDKIRTNIFVGKVKIIGFEMLEADDKTRFCTLDTLVVKMGILKLLSDEIKLNEITIISPQATIIQNGEAFNFDDIIAFYDTPEETEDTTSTNWAVNLNNISLKGGEIKYQDVQIGSNLGMDNLQLSIPHIYFSGENTDVGINLDFEDGGKLGLSVAYGMENENYDLSIKLSDFALSSILPYVKSYFNVSTFDGKLNTDISVKGSVEHIMNILVEGNVNITDFSTYDNKERLIASVKNTNLDIEKIDLEKEIFHFKNLEISQLKSQYIMYDTISTNFDNLFTESEPDNSNAEEDDDESSNNYDLRIDKLKVNDCELVVEDKSLIEDFVFPISKLNISSQNISLNNNFELKIKAILGDKGELKGSWKGNLSNLSNMRLAIFLKNVKLKDFSPYCKHYTAYPISNGLLSFTSISNVYNDSITSSNEVNILNCKIEKKEKKLDPEYKIPLKAGLYVLADRNGKISIDLPISGNISDPTFSLRKTIIKTFCNLIVKVAASPFDAIKHNSEGNNFADINMDFNDHSFTVEHYQQLNKMSEAIPDFFTEKPDAKISVQQQVNKEANINSIALFKLKSDYYLSQTGKTTEQLSIEDYKAIQNIKNHDPKIAAFAAQKLGANADKNIVNSAKKLYETSSLEEIYKRGMERRKRMFSEYLTSQGINTTKIVFIENKEDCENTSGVTLHFGLELPEQANDMYNLELE